MFRWTLGDIQRSGYKIILHVDNQEYIFWSRANFNPAFPAELKKLKKKQQKKKTNEKIIKQILNLFNKNSTNLSIKVSYHEFLFVNKSIAVDVENGKNFSELVLIELINGPVGATKKGPTNQLEFVDRQKSVAVFVEGFEARVHDRSRTKAQTRFWQICLINTCR